MQPAQVPAILVVATIENGGKFYIRLCFCLFCFNPTSQVPQISIGKSRVIYYSRDLSVATGMTSKIYQKIVPMSRKT